MDKLLQGKTAVIYGAGGSLGGAVAKAFAAGGAKVVLTGRRLATVQAVADEILAAGGDAEAEEVDAFDERAVAAQMAEMLKRNGSIDISFNAVGVDLIQNIPLTDISIEEFVRPVTRTLQTRYLTAIVAARIMIQQHSGVILFLTATPGGIGYPFTGGFAPACSAVETLSRNLAAELGINGIRVVCIRSGGSPDSAVFRAARASDPGGMETVIRKMESDTMLKALPSMADIGNAAVFLASDLAARITGVTLDVTCGTTAGLNYRVTSETSDDRYRRQT
jgi:3-oxoacyl-[acyl-carrier protein] reductase